MKPDIIKDITQYKSFHHSFYLGERFTKHHICKYINMDLASTLLRENSIRFSEPTSWPDKYEGRFYLASYESLNVSDETIPKLYAQCFTIKQISEAQTKTYIQTGGLSARAVMFKINLSRFRKAILEKIDTSRRDLYEGLVCYDLKDKEIKELHRKSSKYHNDIVKDFGLHTYLSLLLIKRKAFDYENEFRFFIVDRTDYTGKGIDQNSAKYLSIEITWSSVIDGILIDDNCTQNEEEQFKSLCRDYGINDRIIRRFRLYEMGDNVVMEN